MPNEYPKCPYCGYEFRYQIYHYNNTYSNHTDLQDQWRCGGAWVKKITCPSCGNRCEIDYKCTMRAVSRKVE